jgi:hypothetical protein
LFRSEHQQRFFAATTLSGEWIVAFKLLTRFLFDDDVFVSYSRADGASYAVALANALAGDLSCYFDQWGAVPGTQVPEIVLAAVWGTRGERHVHISPDGQVIATIANGGITTVWDARDGFAIARVTHREQSAVIAKSGSVTTASLDQARTWRMPSTAPINRRSTSMGMRTGV